MSGAFPILWATRNGISHLQKYLSEISAALGTMEARLKNHGRLCGT